LYALKEMNMKTFLNKLRDITIAGFFAQPVYILLLVVAKAWKSLQSLGAGIAGIFGMKPILGIGGGTIFHGASGHSCLDHMRVAGPV
jgi:hypothetical protein